MKVVITGATGNVGTSVIRSLTRASGVERIVGLARRAPTEKVEGVEWQTADVVSTDLVPLFEGADVVVHLAWLIQPSRRLDILERVNVVGSARVFDAVAAAGVPALVYASSIGAYSPGPKDARVDESWPTEGVATSSYARYKSSVERLLDDFEARHPDVRVVRLRKALVFKRGAGSEIRRYFLGPFVPRFALRPSFVPGLPLPPQLVLQAVHGDDVGEAYRLAVTGDATGAFNIAAEPVLGRAELAQALDARQLPGIPASVARAAFALGFRAHVLPVGPGWLDLGLQVPVMDTTRARTELGWQPTVDARDAVLDVLAGMRAGIGMATPALTPDAGPALRVA